LLENVFGNHIVLSEPVSHLTPIPERSGVGDVAYRGRKPSGTPIACDILKNKLASVTYPPGDLGLSDQTAFINPEDFGSDPSFPNIPNRTDDRILK